MGDFETLSIKEVQDLRKKASQRDTWLARLKNLVRFGFEKQSLADGAKMNDARNVVYDILREAGQ